MEIINGKEKDIIPLNKEEEKSCKNKKYVIYMQRKVFCG